MKLLTAFLILLLPAVSFADHRSASIDRDDLDDDIVDEFPIPVLFGIDYKGVTSDYGDPRDGGAREHEGQDFLVPLGTPIVSPTEAIVIKTGTGDSAGKYVYTANPGGETFRYMHLDEFADLDPGDELDEGDYIGTVGDTGNAVGGAYHLHFEVRDEDNNPVDPYTRLDEDGWSLKKKMSFLSDIFKDRRDDDDYAEFLVEAFTSDFAEAVADGYSLPSAIDDVVEDMGLEDEADQREDLAEVIMTIPEILNIELNVGDQGVLVSLLQIYLIYTLQGDARDQLAAAGPTGYYGSITAAVVEEYQDDERLDETGVYDVDTREEMLDRNSVELNLD